MTAQTIPSGASTYTFDVTVNGDAVFEQNEEFVVDLSSVVGATVADGQGVGTITNDDAVPSDVVISQVYGGGGNIGCAPHERLHRALQPWHATINLTGWSVQYLSAAGNGHLGGHAA